MPPKTKTQSKTITQSKSNTVKKTSSIKKKDSVKEKVTMLKDEPSKIVAVKGESDVIKEKQVNINNNDDNVIQKKEDNMYEFTVSEIPKVNNKTESIFDHKANPKYSLINVDYPSFAMGFQHFIHASKNKLEILQEYENKKKVYLVLNPFERYVDNFNESIGEVTKKYFDINNKSGSKPDVLSRGFYKLWEILMTFDLIDKKKQKFTSAHLAEGPGSFIQATMFYRDMFCDDSSKDKYHAVTLHSEDQKNHVPELEKNFINYYEKENPVRFILHKTYNKQIAGGSTEKDNGDITDPKTVKLFGGQMSERADFVTADGGFNWKDENTQEQEAFKLIFAQIFGALKVQKKDGSFVCKVFETFTQMSVKFITILREFYEQIYICKPLMSRPSNSEKYLICKKFKYSENDKEYKSKLDILEQILVESHKNKDENLLDIFPTYQLDKELIRHMIIVNVKIMNTQFKAINAIVDFLNKQNFYGDLYQSSREKQIAANKYWTSMYYPEKGKLALSESKLKNYIKKEVDIIKNKIEQLDKKLI